MISLLMIVVFVALMMLGVPVSVSLILATILGMASGGYDLMLLPQQMAASVSSLELMAIPFFIFAASLMSALGQIAKIFQFAQAAVGWLRGGLAQANVLAGFIFAGISGAAVADAAALGTISMKEMPRAGYSAPFAASVVISVSTLGAIIPPSIMMIVYAITADVSIARMFLAGLLPGVMIAAFISVLIAAMTMFGLTPSPDPSRFSGRALWRATRSAILALLAPIVILRGMTVGVVTPTEAGVLASAYALIVGLVERKLKLGLLWQAMLETVEASAHILFIVAASSAMTYIVISEGAAADVSAFFTSASVDKTTFLIIANIVLLLLGVFIETMPAMLLVLPLLLPTANALGVDLVHFGVVVIFNLLLGMMTPPMGIGLFILSSIGRLGLGTLAVAVLPFLGVLLIALAVLTFFPAISLWLPDLLMPEPSRRF